MSKIQKVDEGFKVTPSSDGKGTTITLKGAGVGIVQIIVFSILALIPLIGFGVWGIVVIGPVIAFFGYAIWYRSRPQSFTVSTEAITKKDKQYAISDIAEMMIANEAQNSLATASPSNSGGLIIAGTGKAGVALAAGTMMGRAANQMVAGAGRSAQRDAAKKGYSIQIRYGRKKIRLVDCLDEDTAISVFNKVVSLTAA